MTSHPSLALPAPFGFDATCLSCRDLVGLLFGLFHETFNIAVENPLIRLARRELLGLPSLIIEKKQLATREEMTPFEETTSGNGRNSTLRQSGQGWPQRP